MAPDRSSYTDPDPNPQLLMANLFNSGHRIRHNLAEFIQWCSALHENSLFNEFLWCALTGEYTDEENIHQVFLDVSRYSIHPQEPLILTHNINSAIGISDNLLVAGPIILWAAPHTGHEVTHSIHLTHTLDVSRAFKIQKWHCPTVGRE